MEQSPNLETKPERLYFKTYLQLIKNSVGTEMFRNFYVKTPERGEFDALDDGKNSCAFYVSGILTLFGQVKGVRGTIDSTVKDMEESGWVRANTKKPGDVLVWETMHFEDGDYPHIGFYVGHDRAISTSWTELKVVEHDVKFGELNRAITDIYRQDKW